MRLIAALLALAGLAFATPALSEDPQALLAPGNAAVTGFSRAASPVSLDPTGPSMRIVDLSDMGGPLDARYAKTAKPYTAKAGEVGQVFGIALDRAVPPNLYVAATSAYGLPIVVRGADGTVSRATVGAPGAAYMPNLFGPNGGPGSVWRIDGVTGAIRLFVNVKDGDAANPGPALGNLAYDAPGDTLIVADRWSGLIHRYRMDGAEAAIYDHGTVGRQAANLTPVPAALAPVDPQTPAFDSSKPETWGYSAPERRPFGVAVHAGRLFYAIAAGEEIWSVSLAADGGFGADARREIAMPPGATGAEISKITFDDAGRMYLAERPAPTGAQDFEAQAQEGVGRVLRYLPDPASPVEAPRWLPDSQEYALGFPRALRNANGGVEIGYDYDERGRFDRRSCGGFLWSTGEVLRHAEDAGLAAQLQAGGPLDVTGLQGNRQSDVRPRNVPPLATYFTDYNEHFEDAGARGLMGDLVIWRDCGASGWREGFDFGFFDLDEEDFGFIDEGGGSDGGGGTCVPERHCCPRGTAPDPSGRCRPWCLKPTKSPREMRLCGLGFDPNGPRCLDGSAPRNDTIFGCAAVSPVFAASVCPAGWSKRNIPGAGDICAPQDKPRCPRGTQPGPNGRCERLCPRGVAWPGAQCCPPDSKLSPRGQCCPAGAWNEKGECCPPGSKVTPRGQCCPAGATVDSAGECCPVDAKRDARGQCCAAGATVNRQGICCPAGSRLDSAGACCPLTALTDRAGRCCAPGSAINRQGQCTRPYVPPPLIGPVCAQEETQIDSKCCRKDSVYPIGGGKLACCPIPLNAQGQCGREPPPPPPPVCGPGDVLLADGVCCPRSQVTGAGTCGSVPPIVVPVCPDGRPPIDGSCDRGPRLCSDGRPPINGRCDRGPRLCPDGRPPINGSCDRGPRLCPDGRPPGPNGCMRLCPDGRPPINGSCDRGPRLCPDGRPPGPNGCVRLCPDGRPPINGSCDRGPRLCPNGRPPIEGRCAPIFVPRQEPRFEPRREPPFEPRREPRFEPRGGPGRGPRLDERPPGFRAF